MKVTTQVRNDLPLEVKRRTAKKTKWYPLCLAAEQIITLPKGKYLYLDFPAATPNVTRNGYQSVIRYLRKLHPHLNIKARWHWVGNDQGRVIVWCEKKKKAE